MISFSRPQASGRCAYQPAARAGCRRGPPRAMPGGPPRRCGAPNVVHCPSALLNAPVHSLAGSRRLESRRPVPFASCTLLNNAAHSLHRPHCGPPGIHTASKAKWPRLRLSPRRWGLLGSRPRRSGSTRTWHDLALCWRSLRALRRSGSTAALFLLPATSPCPTTCPHSGDQGCGQAQGGEEGQEGQGAWSRSNHPTLSI